MSKTELVQERDGYTIGKVVGRRRCQLEGCSRPRLSVRWPDGRLTIPCTGGMHVMYEDPDVLLWKITSMP